MKLVVLIVALAAISVGGWVGYRATKPKKDCHVVRVNQGFGETERVVCK